MMDFDNVKRQELKMYPQHRWVSAPEWDALLSAYKELRRQFAESIEARASGIKNPQP